ncbi:MAG: hypothetical protein L0J23_05335, partial [Bifidobacterium crudilactis]|nr:hypothetical protein [Bifidobacterium crudilactis]
MPAPIYVWERASRVIPAGLSSGQARLVHRPTVSCSAPFNAQVDCRRSAERDLAEAASLLCQREFLLL